VISPPVETVWLERKFMFSNVFQIYFDEKIKNKALVPIPDSAVSWLAAGIKPGEPSKEEVSSKEPRA